MNKVQEVMNSKELLYGGKMRIYMHWYGLLVCIELKHLHSSN